MLLHVGDETLLALSCLDEEPAGGHDDQKPEHQEVADPGWRQPPGCDLTDHADRPRHCLRRAPAEGARPTLRPMRDRTPVRSPSRVPTRSPTCGARCQPEPPATTSGSTRVAPERPRRGRPQPCPARPTDARVRADGFGLNQDGVSVHRDDTTDQRRLRLRRRAAEIQAGGHQRRAPAPSIKSAIPAHNGSPSVGRT